MYVRPLPSQDLIHRLLRYDLKTGDLIWLPRSADLITDNNKRAVWNSRYAGKVAGYPRPQHEPRRGYYLVIGINGAIYKAHRLVWLHVRGEPVPDRIDHQDTDQLNNRIENLRAATMPLNRANSKVRIDNKLGVKGVYPTKQGRFIAKAGNAYLGTFATIEEASAAYLTRAKALYGEFARTDHRQK